MRAFLSGLAIAVVLLSANSHAHGQKATEQYIPIGQSPGLSGKYTYLGLIKGVNGRERTITVADAAGPRSIKISPTTRIWLDRNKLKKPNLTGSFADLQTGRRVEVKFVDRTRQAAEWVKLEITGP